MPDSEKPADKNGKKPFHKRRRFRKNREQQQNSQNQQPAVNNQAQAPAGGQGQQTPRSQDKSYNKNRDNRNKFREKAPLWDAEDFLKAAPLPDTKEELQEILAAVDPEELMMTPLFQKRKYTKPASESSSESSEEALIPEELFFGNTPKVTIDVVNSCPICDKPIREIMYALHDYEHNKLAHFDCVFKKVSESLKDKLTGQCHLAYLGSGAFGIMEPIPNKPNKERLVEKIYPGAPVEELLHAGENQPDEEL